MHVLLVEDDAVLADGLCRILQSHAMAVDVVGNGAQADQPGIFEGRAHDVTYDARKRRHPT